MHGICVPSLLPPRVSGLQQPPPSNSASSAEYGNCARAVEIAGTGQIDDSVIEIAQIILRGAVGLEDQTILSHEYAVVKSVRCSSGAEAIRSRIWKSRLYRELNIGRQGKCSHRDWS